jgi:hypothetical protein
MFLTTSGEICGCSKMADTLILIGIFIHFSVKVFKAFGLGGSVEFVGHRRSSGVCREV